MTHPLFHAQSSVRRFGGKVEDYLGVHHWLDAGKEAFCDFRHRALQDCGGIVPSVADWLSRIRPETWMSRGYSLSQGDPPTR